MNGHPFSIAQRSIEMSLIRGRLEKATVGELITYGELSELIGRDIQRHRYFLMSARRSLLNEVPPHRLVFSAVESVGVLRLSDAEIVGSSQHHNKSIRRRAPKGIKELMAVDIETLSSEDKTKSLSQQSVLGALQAITKPSMVKRITTHIVDNVLPPANLLDVFKRTDEKP